MKRAAAVLLTLALMLSLTACMSRGSMQLKRADRYFDDLRGAFKMSDVTNSARLIGKRENNGRDWFTGSYTAQCENETGRDKSESLYQNRVRQRGNTPENERKSARIYARRRRQIQT